MPRAKGKVIFVCEACGNENPKWEGRCPACGAWATLAEMQRESSNGRRASWVASSSNAVVRLSEVSTEELPRLAVSSVEVNRVLGGGIVPGSITLIAGDPGIGKSTLLLRLAADTDEKAGAVLYVSGEESAAQVKMRAERLGVSSQNLFVLTATNVDEVLGYLDSQMPALVVVDSIQTLYAESLTSEPGSVAQIRECARRLLEWSKARNVPVLLTGHVTKGGEIAGPRILEHMVDVVLYMEGDPVSSWRLLRGVKNRFGSTNEVGVFEMTGHGLVDVSDPSRSLLSERVSEAIGSAIVPVMEGSRPLLVEVQALTNPSMLPAPRRVATGFDYNRLLMVCAVLTRRASMSLSNQDVLVNATGGLKITEPAADLAVALAIASSFRNAPIDPDVAAVGEVGLSGEVRRVPQLERRVREAARLGFQKCLVPVNACETLKQVGGIEIIPVGSLASAVNACIPREPRMRDAEQHDD